MAGEDGAGRGPAGQDDGHQRSPFASKWFIAAAVFLVIICLMGGWVITGHLFGGPAGAPSTAPAARQPGSPGASSADPGGDGGSVCGLAAGDQQVPDQAPSGQIETVAPGVEIPVVEGVGPGQRDGITRCFAHSPTGAVVAGVNWIKWFSAQQRLPEVITTLMIPGPDRDRLARQVDDGWDGSTGQAVAVHGFKVDVRTSDEVLVTLAISLGQDEEGLVSWPVLLRWQDGDWKAVAPQTESWGQESVESVAAGGFTPWRV